MTSKSQRQPAGLYHFPLGDMTITAVNDGVLPVGFDMFAGVDPVECERIERAAFRAVPPKLTVNTFLLRHQGHLTLIDTGCGSGAGPALGLLLANLASMGIAPSDIDTVLLTHLHPDHIDGLLGPEGEAVFANAELVVNEAELQFFLDPMSPSRAPDGEPQKYFERFRQVTKPYLDRIRTVRDGPALPGVTAVTQPGHTPGQTGWLVESGGDAVMVWGDVIHMPHLQFVAPHAATVLDVDRDQAIATRRRALDMAATERLRVAGTHFDFPAFGHVERRGDTYAFVPEVWRPFT